MTASSPAAPDPRCSFCGSRKNVWPQVGYCIRCINWLCHP